MASLDEIVDLLDARSAQRSSLAALDKRLRKATKPHRKAAKFYAGRVVEGVEFLEEKVPGWTAEDKISLTDLQLSDGEQCVLGQLAARSALTGAGYDLDGYMEYSGACRAMSIHGEDYGFCTVDDLEMRLQDDWGWGENDSWNLLNHMWTHAIRAAREGRTVTKKELVEAVRIV